MPPAAPATFSWPVYAQWVRERAQSQRLKFPHFENSYYGVFASFLGEMFPPALGFIVKPQYRVAHYAHWNAGPDHKRTDSTGRETKDTDIAALIPDFVITWVSDVGAVQKMVLIVEYKLETQPASFKLDVWKKDRNQLQDYLELASQKVPNSDGVPGILMCGSVGYRVVTTINQQRKLIFDHQDDAIRLGISTSVWYDPNSSVSEMMWNIRNQTIAGSRWVQDLIDIVAPALEPSLPVYFDALIDAYDPDHVDYEASLHGPVMMKYQSLWTTETRYITKPQAVLQKEGHERKDSYGNETEGTIAKIADYVVAQVQNPPGSDAQDLIKFVAELKRGTEQAYQDQVIKQLHDDMQLIFDLSKDVEKDGRRVHGMAVLGTKCWRAGWKKEGNKLVPAGPNFNLPGVSLKEDNNHPFWREFDTEIPEAGNM